MDVAGKGPSAGKSRGGRFIGRTSLYDKAVLNAIANGNGFHDKTLKKSLLSGNGPVVALKTDGRDVTRTYITSSMDVHKPIAEATIDWFKSLRTDTGDIDDISGVSVVKSEESLKGSKKASWIVSMAKDIGPLSAFDYDACEAIKDLEEDGFTLSKLEGNTPTRMLKIRRKNGLEAIIELSLYSKDSTEVLIISRAYASANHLMYDLEFDLSPYVALEEDTKAPTMWRFVTGEKTAPSIVTLINKLYSSLPNSYSPKPIDGVDTKLAQQNTDVVEKVQSADIPSEICEWLENEKIFASLVQTWSNYSVNWIGDNVEVFRFSDKELEGHTIKTKQRVESSSSEFDMCIAAFIVHLCIKLSKTHGANKEVCRSPDHIEWGTGASFCMKSFTVLNWLTSSSFSYWDSLNPYLYLKSENPGSNGLNSDINVSFSENLTSQCIWFYPTTQLCSVFQSLASITMAKSIKTADPVSDTYKEMCLASPSQQEVMAIDKYSASTNKDVLLTRNLRGVVDGQCYIGNVSWAKKGTPGITKDGVASTGEGIAIDAIVSCPSCIAGCKDAAKQLAAYDHYLEGIALNDLVYVTTRNTERHAIELRCIPVISKSGAMKIATYAGPHNLFYVENSEIIILDVTDVESVLDTWVFGLPEVNTVTFKEGSDVGLV